MKRFVEGEDRYQSTLFPETLDDYIAEDNHVKVIDAFIDELDLSGVGFRRVEPRATGRPAYHPSTLLKIYVYGYLNHVQSSRRLEKEAQRNVELMWLTGRLAPDFRTIADFRKDNGGAIRAVCREFIVLCRQINLFSEAMVVIDGSKFKAVNNRNKNFTRAKMKRRLEQIEKSLDRYFSQLDSLDRQEGAVAEDKVTRIDEKIAALKQQMREAKRLEEQMLESPDKQISLTDPDARAIATNARSSGVVGYNVQTAVDAKHHLIVAHEVTNVGSDRGQLSNMAKKARTAMDAEDLTVVTDRGYYKSEELLACHEAGITTYVPKPQTSGAQAAGRFGRRDFQYIPEADEYRCPAGDRLVWRYASKERGLTMHRYWSSNCQSCHLKPKCTPSKQRRISRWEHEAVLEAAQERLDRDPDKMRRRKEIVEHPFGTIKSWMGSSHFQMKTLQHVSTEMSLHVLAYNLKRVMNIMGIKPLIQAMQA
ncbi:MAG: IS1182 family transposase [Gammaproteobacteria bacterium]|nr:IS1182 family transposase [Gammaproteobacteria bacterium]